MPRMLCETGEVLAVILFNLITYMQWLGFQESVQVLIEQVTKMFNVSLVIGTVAYCI